MSHQSDEQEEFALGWMYEDAFPMLWPFTPNPKSSLIRQRVHRMSEYKNLQQVYHSIYNKKSQEEAMPTHAIVMKLQYCQFLCCLSDYLLKHPAITSQCRMVFKMDNVITDCYWFELIYHLTLLVRMLVKGPVKDDIDTMLNSRGVIGDFIGCYHYLMTVGIETCLFLEKMPDVRPAFTTLQHEFEAFRCWVIRASLNDAYQDDKAHGDIVVYSNALLQCKHHSDHRDTIIQQCDMDIKEMNMIASALYLRDEGEFSDALTLLEAGVEADLDCKKHLNDLRQSLISARIKVDLDDDEDEEQGRTVEKALKNPKLIELGNCHAVMRTGRSPLTCNKEIYQMFPPHSKYR